MKPSACINTCIFHSRAAQKGGTRTDDVVDKVLLRILLAVIGNGKGNHHLRGQIGSIGASRIDSCGCAAQKPRSIQIQLFGQQSDSTQRHMVPEGGSTKYACSVFAISEPYACLIRTQPLFGFSVVLRQGALHACCSEDLHISHKCGMHRIQPRASAANFTAMTSLQ